MYTKAQIKKYLEHIHYSGSLEANLDNLIELHKLHLLYIPYENLDLMNNKPLSLDYNDLFEKIILNNRGGYCFELQGLFYYLLKSLGYKVEQYAGRFMDEPWHIQMRRHRVLVVEISEKRYVCDIGVRSESFRCPLELTEGFVQSDGISEYKYEKDDFYGWVLMQREKGKNWKTILGFTEEPQIDDDYVMPSFYCEKHPDSTFNKFMKISIFTEDSNINFVENNFKIYREANIVENREIKTNEEAIEILKNVFKIDVPKDYKIILYDKDKKE